LNSVCYFREKERKKERDDDDDDDHGVGGLVFSLLLPSPISFLLPDVTCAAAAAAVNHN
jgi:hypothetical protein